MRTVVAALAALLCACLPQPHGECASDADCAGGAPGSFCAEGICQGPPRGALDAIDSRAFARSETLHVRVRVTRAHGATTARVLFGGGVIAAQPEADGALGADVPLALAPEASEGGVPFSIELRDDLGHLSAVPASVTVDDKPPRVTIDPATVPSSAVVRGAKVSLRVTVQDLTAVTIAGVARNADGSFTIVADTAKSAPDTTSLDVPITAVDAVGNATTVHATIPVTRLKFAVAHPSGRALSSLVLTDSAIYALADHSEFWFLQRGDGSSIAEPPSGGTAFPEIATDGTRLFFARSDNYVCRMGADGSIQLCCPANGTLTAGPILWGSDAIVGTTGTGSPASQKIIAFLDGATCNPASYGPGLDFAATSPAIGPDGNIYAGLVQAITVQNFDGNGWSINHQLTSETPHYRGSPAFRVGGAVLLAAGPVGTADTFAFVDPLGAAAPAPVTTQVAPVGVTVSSPTIAADGTAVFATDDRHVVALRPDNSVRWSATLPDAATAPPTHGDGGLVYVGTAGGEILALNISDGSAAWSYQAGSAVRGPLAPGCDGILYAATDGAVLALVIDKPGLADSPWPKAAHDVRGSGDARRPNRSGNGGCVE